MSFEESLKKNWFIVTTEVQVPGDEPPEEMLKRLERLKGRTDGISLVEAVAEEAAQEEQGRGLEAVVGDTINTCDILQAGKFEPIYRAPARQKNRPGLQEDLIKAADHGVENLLVFTEDYRITGDSLQEIMFFHVDAGKVISVLDHLGKGVDIAGQDLVQPVRFCMGSGVEAAWGGRLPDMQLREMEHMIQGGTQYFLTTPVFDMDKFAAFMKRVGPLGIPVIAEVMIMRSAVMARHMNRYMRPGLVPDRTIEALAQSKDKEATSIEIFTDIIEGLKGICRGIHVVSMGAEEKLHHYLDAAKLR